MTTSSGSDGLEVVVRPASERYDSSDERWLDQVSTLVSTIREEVGPVRVETGAAEGTKGGVEAIVLALGSSGAFVAAVELLKAWLSRDRSRSVEITWRESEHERTVVVTADTVDAPTFQEIAKEAARRWSQPRTSESTERS